MDERRAPKDEELDVDPTVALDDLTSALIQTPQAYEVFVRLSAQEQVGLVEWVNSAANPRNRERRLRTICAVLARIEAESVSMKDALWLDGQRIIDSD